ncbi:DUF6389 family protein [Microbacterium binotii]|uniref:DUF6389 family protein n=1 Tax=Microbacterium binotii TaxID=462710 RepID=UPI001F3C1005|nr:DUF6389 family protein [Microbacterium binotii]UIN31763.1 DUF6389 family protein [Microbacterium binotii]
MSDDYRSRLRPLLAAESERAADVLQRMADATESRHDIVIEVFLEQDAEGPFTFMARFDGPDHFALDRRFDDERGVFDVVWGETGWKPDVPERPDAWTFDDLEEVLVELAAEWLAPLIPAEPARVRWEVASPDGGTDSVPLEPRRARS